MNHLGNGVVTRPQKMVIKVLAQRKPQWKNEQYRATLIFKLMEEKYSSQPDGCQMCQILGSIIAKNEVLNQRKMLGVLLKMREQKLLYFQEWSWKWVLAEALLSQYWSIGKQVIQGWHTERTKAFWGKGWVWCSGLHQGDWCLSQLNGLQCDKAFKDKVPKLQPKTHFFFFCKVPTVPLCALLLDVQLLEPCWDNVGAMLGCLGSRDDREGPQLALCGICALRLPPLVKIVLITTWYQLLFILAHYYFFQGYINSYPPQSPKNQMLEIQLQSHLVKRL